MEIMWRDSLGNPIDVTDIDKEYALNIYTMVIQRRTRWGYTAEDLREDELVQALRETVLHGREPNERDRLRAVNYNLGNRAADLPFRAPE